MKPPLIINGCTYHLPESPEDVMQLVNQAKDAKQTISVRGSAHSMPLIPTNETQKQYLFVMLAYMNNITDFNHDTGLVKVQAGCHLGWDPNDPTGVSTVENSLNYQLDPFDLKKGMRTQAPGWALPDLGGISYQAVGGFLATGSAGGATQFSLEDAIMSVDVIHHDGVSAKLTTFNRPADNNEDDPFWGVAYANLGLMGIVVSVTFQCIKAYNIYGTETTSTYDGGEVDFFGKGTDTKPSFQAFLEDKFYTRLFWYPQTTVQKMTLWKAWPVDASLDWQSFKSNIYKEFPFIFGTPKIAEWVVGKVFDFFGNWPNWVRKIVGNKYYTSHDLQDKFDDVNDVLLKLMLSVFEPINTAKKPPQEFWDVWWNSLPMDNQVSDNLFSFYFTELWIPIEQTQKVMDDLKVFYNNAEDSGMFAAEIYATKDNLFWLSPANKTKVVRVDILFYQNNSGKPEDYYQRFWTELAKYNYRPHWGKYLPPSSSPQGVAYLKERYSDTWDKWMNLRTKMDPNNLFLTAYWNDHLFGVKQK